MTIVTASDGVNLVLHSTGTGPGIVVVHGGGVTIAVYRGLARALGSDFTVHLYNRRGRADAPERRLPYSFEQEIEDLDAILSATGATNVIGHSSGGFIALTAAKTLAISRVAVYDAAISVDGSFPTAWLEPAVAAARIGNMPLAMALTAGGINTQSPTSRLPLGVQVALCRGFLRTSIGHTMGDLLAMTLDESTLIRDADGPSSLWSGITAEVLLAYGAAGPRYYPTINAELAAAMPRARVLPVARAGHDGINRAPQRLIEPLHQFFHNGHDV